MEYAISLPLLLVTLVGIVDSAQLILLHAQLDHATREFGNLVSRGDSTADAWTAVTAGQWALDLNAHARVVFTTVARHSNGDARPWVRNQTALGGGHHDFTSLVGAPHQPATIPGVVALDPGVVLTAIEASYDFIPLIPLPNLLGFELPDHAFHTAYF